LSVTKHIEYTRITAEKVTKIRFYKLTKANNLQMPAIWNHYNVENVHKKITAAGDETPETYCQQAHSTVLQIDIFS